MKKSNFLLLCLLGLSSTLLSQEISLKYGKVTEDELNMKTYQKDTTAAAVVLYENGNTFYEYTDGEGFRVCTEESKKVKVLKQEGVNEANISIPYYYIGAGNKEIINKIEAIAYNLENGKIVKTKLDKKYIFEEEINSYIRQVKFSVPDVKVGTVIEYKYTRTSGNAHNLPNWEFQGHIPVMNSDYEVLIPQYYTFRLSMKGYESVTEQEKEQFETFTLGSVANNGRYNTVSSKSRDIKFSAKDLPAMKVEDNVWCLRDFTSGVRFELESTQFPFDYFKPYTRSWEELENVLKKSDFGTNLQMADIYRNEIKALTDSLTDESQKIERVYSFIKDHIRWNEKYTLFGNDAKDAAKNGTVTMPRST